MPKPIFYLLKGELSIDRDRYRGITDYMGSPKIVGTFLGCPAVRI